MQESLSRVRHSLCYFFLVLCEVLAVLVAPILLTAEISISSFLPFSFMLKGAGPRMRDLTSHFTVAPQSGMLIASQPGVNIEMLFQPKREMLLKNRPILYCQVSCPGQALLSHRVLERKQERCLMEGGL